jgi:hypothetical protein
VIQIDQVQQHLHAADGVPAVLSASWKAFELVQAVTATCADLTADMYPAFTFARGSAVSGRNAIAFAPSMPAGYAQSLTVTTPDTGDVYEVADAVAGLASVLGARLREAAALAANADDRTACEDAALDAEQITALLAKGE